VKPFHTLIRLAVPLALVQMAYQATAFVDTAFAGRIDDLSLAATGLGASILFAFAVCGLGVGLAMDPLTSQAVGAGDERDARAVLCQGLWVATALCLPVAAVTLVVAANLEAFGIAPELAERTRSYIFARLPAIWPLFLSVNMRAFLQAHHRTAPIVVAAVTTNVANVLGNALLVFPRETFQLIGIDVSWNGTGVAGLGWASVAALAAQAAVLAVAVGRIPMARPQRLACGRILKVGLPIGLQLTTEVGLFSMTQVLMARMGVLAGAAHQVALMLAAMSFSISLGVGAATSVQVGRSVGRQDPAATRRAGVHGMLISVMVMACAAVAMWTVPHHLAAVLSNDPQVLARAVSLLRIAAVFQLVDGVQAVIAGALRGAGVTRWTFVAHLVAHWGLGLPVGVGLAFALDRGPEGLWWGLTTGLSVAALATTWKFLQVSGKTIARI
jgi:MATE family multidrug resistance protein